MGKNPLHCNCNLKWLANYLEQNPSVETSEAKCASPATRQARKLGHLARDEFTCEGKLLVAAISITFSSLSNRWTSVAQPFDCPKVGQASPLLSAHWAARKRNDPTKWPLNQTTDSERDDADEDELRCHSLQSSERRDIKMAGKQSAHVKRKPRDNF